MNLEQLKKRKILLPVVIIAIVFLILLPFFVIIILSSPTKPEEYIGKLFEIRNYNARIVYNDPLTDTFEEKVFFTKGEGYMKIDENNEPEEFQFPKQNIFKNFNGEWDMIITDDKYEAGSIESILENTQKEVDMNSMKVVEDDSYCERVKLDDKSCKVINFKKGESSFFMYFDKDTKNIKLIRSQTGTEEKQIYFEKINDPQISVGAKFEQLRSEIQTQVRKNVE